MDEKILVVDDEDNIRASLAGILEDEGFRPMFANDGVTALDVMRKELPDLVLLDIWMPRMDGIETLQRMRELYPPVIIIMMSGHGTIETAVKSTKMGAYDFIEKPISLEKLLLTIKNSLSMKRLRDENETLREMAYRERGMTGSSPAMAKLQEQILLVAPTNASVLITGENGTGKELVARSIHFHSQRKDLPFVDINCAAIPEELIESELFGHEKGAFTGAIARKKGRFDQADGGTLFLDEIGDMSLKTQAKILRILQEKKFERVGGNLTIEVDVRIIAATNKRLEEEIRRGTFREDLYYRLNVVPFTVPPLRERREDIPLLIEHFLELFRMREGLERKTVTPEAVELLKRRPWPGNVRELKNVVERLIIMTPGAIITAAHISDSMISGAPSPEACAGRFDGLMDCATLREARDAFEKEFILGKLEENSWNISKTAEAIELERSNLHRKIKSYGIEMRK
jgi:two-component system nitrogen regulation response regulator NtrX